MEAHINLVPFITRGVGIDASSTQLNRILRAIRTHLHMEVGFIAEFKDGRRVFRQVDSAEGSEILEVGGSDPLEESYCYWVAQGRLPKLLRDPAEDPFAACLPATHSLPVGAHISVRIRLRDGRIYGTFCCFSRSPDPTLTARDLAMMEAFAEVAGEQIQDSLDRDRERQSTAQRIEVMIAERDLEIVYQPAVASIRRALSSSRRSPASVPTRTSRPIAGSPPRFASALEPSSRCSLSSSRSRGLPCFRRRPRSASTSLPTRC